ELRLQRLVDLLVRDHARRGGAALTRRSERRPEDALDREIDVGVVENDDRVLAAELEVHVLEPVGRGLRHRDAGLARAGERDDRNARVAYERVAGGLAVAVHDVDDARAQARLVEAP